MRMILGVCLVCFPFALATGMMIATAGIATTLGIWGTVLLLIACIWGGIYLINPLRS